MNIGEVSKKSGVSAKMIRYYETKGLLRKPSRSEGGYRVYGIDDVHTLHFIAQARKFGFDMKAIKALVSLWNQPQRASRDVKKIVVHHIEEIETKLKELEAMREGLVNLASCCRGDQKPTCPILNAMAGVS